VNGRISSLSKQSQESVQNVQDLSKVIEVNHLIAQGRFVHLLFLDESADVTRNLLDNPHERVVSFTGPLISDECMDAKKWASSAFLEVMDEQSLCGVDRGDVDDVTREDVARSLLLQSFINKSDKYITGATQSVVPFYKLFQWANFQN